MMIQLSDLVTPATKDAFRANLVNGLKALGIPADRWRTTGSLSSILTVLAGSLAGFSITIANAIAGQFLNLATGDWLTLLAFYVYGVSRVQATQASGPLTLTNAQGGIWNFAPGQATFKNSTTGQTYTNVDAVALGVVNSPTASQTISIQATSFGTAGGASIGQVDTVVTTMTGVSCSNALPVVGLDSQSDPSLRQTCLAKLGASSVRGPTTAFQYYATRNPDGSLLLNSSGAPVNVNRVAVSNASHTGTITVTVASPQGVPTADDLSTVTTNLLANARPGATTLIVQGATPVNYGPTLLVWAKNVAGVDAATLQAASLLAIASFLSTYDIGGLKLAQPAQPSGVQQGLFGTGIDGAISGAVAANGSFTIDIDGSTDLALTTQQVPVFSGSLSVRMVSATS
jgi:phage-related baseplate assembly protein